MDGGLHAPSRPENGRFTPRNSRGIWGLQFVQISPITICYFYPPFLFWRSYPPRMPGLTAAACINSGGGRPNPPGSRGFVPGLPSQTWPIHAVSTVATAASLHAGPCAHMRAQMSASEPRLVPVHALCGRTCSEERAATHPTLYGAAGAARAPHAVPGARLRGHARAAGTSPPCARCW